MDGPLDLRLNQEKGISAAERLDTISREELAGMLYENSDEPYCEELAKAITEEIRKGHRIDTTTKLRQVIEQTLSFLPENKEKKDIIRKTCQRTFQALRIDVNHEFEVLYEFMEKLPGALKPGGRVAILTFHSGEDKLVKKALKAGYREGVYSEYAKDVVRPSAEECAQNGRARSTKMRWAVKAEYATSNKLLADLSIPVVFIDRKIEKSGNMGSVQIDNYQAMKEVAEYISKKGCNGSD